MQQAARTPAVISRLVAHAPGRSRASATRTLCLAGAALTVMACSRSALDAGPGREELAAGGAGGQGAGGQDAGGQDAGGQGAGGQGAGGQGAGGQGAGDCTLAVPLLPAAAWRFGGPLNERSEALAGDGATTLMAASFQGALDLGGGEASNGAGSGDTMWARFDTGGAHLQGGVLSSNGFLDVRGLRAAAGQVVLAGAFGGVMTVGGEQLDAGGPIQHAFAAVLNGAGNTTLALSFGGAAQTQLNDVRVAANGDLVVVGHYRGDMVIGGFAVDHSDADDGLVARFNAAGELLWGGAFADGASGDGFAIDLPAGSLLLQLNGQGNVVSHAAMAGASFPSGLALNGDGAYVTGSFNSAMQAGDTLLQSAGQFDVFLARLLP